MTDLSFLSVVEDGPDDYVVGNGETFINVPAIGAEVVRLLDGTRTPAEVRSRVLREHGVDVDVEDFLTGLGGAGLLRPPEVRPNLWDRVRPGHVRWLFSRPAHLLVAVLFAGAVAAMAVRPEVSPTYTGLVWTNSLAFTLTFAAASWLLVFVHELSHIAAARSLGVRAELSLGTRLQFLVAQTRVTGVWRLPRRARYRVHLAGMRTDLAIASAGTCYLAFAGPSPADGLVRLAVLICWSQIAWQFLFFMRTDVYYAYANLTGEKNLMDDAQAYLRAVLARRPRPPVARGVRAYARFLVVGRVLGLAFFAGYMVPITVAACARAWEEYQASPGSLTPLATIAVIAAGWLLYVYVFVRQRLRSRRTAGAAAPERESADVA
ncbi:hypothetical protein [Bailinhaonella thermotolerans]|nr:hypothetical protein [Bailinhaonella thermotolerans]